MTKHFCDRCSAELDFEFTKVEVDNFIGGYHYKLMFCNKCYEVVRESFATK